MDEEMFKKMKAKPHCAAAVFYAPAGYPKSSEMIWNNSAQADFVHLFIESREQFAERFPQVAKVCTESGSFWISYPRSEGKKKYDINRDSLWGLLLSAGFHPVMQVALDEEWSAVRVKKNEAGVVYEPPSNVKRSNDV